MFRDLAGKLCPNNIEDDDKVLLNHPDYEIHIHQRSNAPIQLPKAENPITLNVNGKDIIVDTSKVSTSTSLARFIRDQLHLTGTKISCNQAGCGACVVNATFQDPATGQSKTRSINSCITPVLKCDGWSIKTVEGLGNKAEGLHEIQQALDDFHGTQCGFCTPGMVMVMNGLLENNSTPSIEDVENLLDGNICRCTGYRPILDAFKSLTPNPPKEVLKKMADIEDLVTKNGQKKYTCPKTQKPCTGKCATKPQKQPNTLQLVKTVDGEWYKPDTIDELMVLLDDVQPGSKYRMVMGNTGTGIFNNDGPYDQYFDLTGISELTSITSSPFRMGAGVALTDFMTALQSKSQNDDNYKYCQQIFNHLQKVANVNVRNVASIGGNLMLKHIHNEFPSDVFILLESVGATLTVRDTDGSNSDYSPLQWLGTSMDKKLLLYITLPQLTPQHTLMSYKITPRRQNAHAYVNAAFMALLEDIEPTVLVMEQPKFVFGGLSENFNHASNTESYLVAKNLNDNTTLTGALNALKNELIVDEDPVLASVQYRNYLAQALLYKFFITAIGDYADAAIQSGATQIIREISSGNQTFTTDQQQYPITQVVPKYEGKLQTTGEAVYIDDIEPGVEELFAAYVLSTVAACEIDTIDISVAMQMPGVVDYVDHNDIPGINTIDGTVTCKEEIFSTGKIYTSGQAIGLIIADSHEHAREAAKNVIVTYKNKQTPITDIRDAINSVNKFKYVKPGIPIKIGNSKPKVKQAAKEVSGELEIGSQYHFHMETQSCIVKPIEDGQFEIYAASQWMNPANFVLSKALGINMNKFSINVRRLGGGFGAKLTQSIYPMVGCAIAANKLKKPVRCVLDLQTNMEMMGKRCPYYMQYNATLDDDNKLQSVNYNFYVDSGFSGVEPEHEFVQDFVQTAYNAGSWNVTPYDVNTDTPSTTSCRAPVTTQCHAVTEIIFEHLATVYGLDPVDLRINNFLKPGDSLVGGGSFSGTNPLPEIISDLKISSNYDQRVRQVATFNQNNAWKKRGICIVPMRWQFSLVGIKISFQISICANDGTVSISVGGIEMGQGLNTKVVQVVAKTLDIGMDLISVKPSNNFVAVNNTYTGGSTGSDMACAAALITCQELRQRMIDAVGEQPTWIELVKACDENGIDLSARHMANTIQDDIRDYDIYAAVATEVEIDVLTGEKNVRRVDLTEDTGASISPAIDVGQVEGGFIMSIGLWTTEEIKYHPTTGRLLTKDTWEYKPPESHEIPEIFNVNFYNSGNNPNGVLGSKATGEPSVLLGVSLIIAIRNAINAVKTDLGQDITNWYNLDAPATNENVQLTSGITSQSFYI